MHQNLAADALRRESGQRPAWVCRVTIHGVTRLTRPQPWHSKADAPLAMVRRSKRQQMKQGTSVMFSHEPSYFVVSQMCIKSYLSTAAVRSAGSRIGSLVLKTRTISRKPTRCMYGRYHLSQRCGWCVCSLRGSKSS